MTTTTDDYGRHAEAIAEIFAAHPGLEAALNIRHSVVASIAVDLATFGRISEKQIALVFKIAEEQSTKRAEASARQNASRDQQMARMAEAWAARQDRTA